MFINLWKIASSLLLASFLWLGAFICVGASDAFAWPAWGGNCTNCHTAGTNLLNISGNNGNSNLTSRIGGGSLQLPLYQITAGSTATIPLNFIVNPGTDMFAVALTGTTTSGKMSESLLTDKGVSASSSDILGLVPDPNWTKQTLIVNSGTGSTLSPSVYYTLGEFAGTGGLVTETFNLGITPNTKPDYYSLTMRASGLGDSQWTQSREILLQVVSAPEPATLVMLLTGGVCFAGVVWRRRRERQTN
jgi:hypothetical protein